MLKTITLLFSFSVAVHCFSQRGKDNSYTVTATNTQVNAYTSVTANATAGATSITVANNLLTNSFFASALGQGDLIMIIQMQGATMDVDVTATASWGGHYTTPNGHLLDWGSYQDLWGNVTSYNNAGKYELIEVKSVTGSNTINLMCGLQNSYTVSGHVQVVRVPRLQNLTLNANMTVVPALWDGSTGGVVALEILGTLTLNTNSKILATGYGFRGGVCDIQTAGSPPGSAANVGYCASDAATEGAEKGEGIGGYYAEYDALYSRYCKSAPANGGGGGGNHNAGGGGGSNIGTGTYTGKGNPQAYAAVWNLESAGFGGSASSGGGRGGYSYSTSNQNETTIGPNNTAWSGDYRRSEGGLGGHPLTYDATRMFMGGGGGAGDANSNPTQGGAGGRGGGIVYLTVYGTISGTGGIEANGAAGQNANPAGQTAPSASSTKYGNDGAGGAGGGGAIVLSNGTAIPNTVALTANGGTGGNQVISFGSFASPAMESDGPGGGGAGGMIAYTSGSPVQSVTGGLNGTTNSTHVNLFPPNGATAGGAGSSGLVQPYFNITANDVTICPNTSATLTATVVGALPVSASLTWYSTQFGSTVLGTGATYTTPVLSATTTYYVGTCPGTFRIPVIVTVSGPVISGTAVVTNANCTTGGSVTGLTVSGGTNPLTITWNGVVTPTMDLTNAAAGTYSVLVTDASGCTATSGPYTINSTSGPVINTSGMTITPTTCGGNTGSITGITASGTGLSYSWTNGTATLDNTALAAGTYTLTVTDNLGCIANTGPYTIASPSGPVIDATATVVTNTTCGTANGSITGITATGTGLTYFWNGMATVTPDLTTVTAGSYTLTVTDNNGCTATSGPYVIPDEQAAVIDMSAMSIAAEHCGNADGSISGILVTGTAPFVYSWSPGAYATLDITNLTTGNYTLTVTDDNGCQTVSAAVNVPSMAGPTTDDASMIITAESCNGNDGSITGITATGSGLTYEWNGVAASGADLTNVTAGNYTLIITDAFGCTATTGPYTITGATTMSIDATNLVITPTSCMANDGQINGLTVNGGVNPVMSWSNGESTADISNLAAGTYTITVTDAQNCIITANYTVVMANGPIIDLLAITDASCEQSNGSVTVTASGGTGVLNYSADNGVSFQANGTFSNLTGAAYTILVVDQSGCFADSSVQVATTPVPQINTVQTTDPVCGNTDGTITVDASGGTGTLQYSIDGGVSYVTANVFTNLGPGNFNVLVNDNNNCAVQQIVTLTSQNGPVVDAGADQTICEGESVTLSGSGAVSYVWSDNVINNVGFVPQATTTYTVTGTDALGCTGTDQVTVTVNPGLTVSAVASVSQGCAPLTVTFQNTTANSGDVIWQFSNGTTLGGTGDQTVTFNQPGCYDLTLNVVAVNGCQASQVFDDIVCVHEAPVAVFVPTPSIMTALETTSTMVNASSNATVYTWNFGDGSTSQDISPVHQFPIEQTGVYDIVLTATNAAGCTDVATMSVIVNEELIFYVPNTFTPNEDEFNVVFLPVFTSGFNAQDYLLQIYDRWGEVVFKSNDYLEGWDGTFKGQRAKDGVYTYRIEFKVLATDERKLVHGSVTLLR